MTGPALHPARRGLSLGTGAAMLAIGLYLAMRPLWSADAVTGARWLDMLFAAAFMVRGLMNLRRARR